MFTSYLKATRWGNEKISSLTDANGKSMTNGGQISKKTSEAIPFRSLRPHFVFLPFPCPALPALPSPTPKEKKKSESKAENESSPEVTAAPFKEKSRNKGELALT